MGGKTASIAEDIPRTHNSQDKVEGVIWKKVQGINERGKHQLGSSHK